MASPRTTLDPIDDAAANFEYTADADFYANDPILEILYNSGDGSYILDFDAHLRRLSRAPFLRSPGPAGPHPSELPSHATVATSATSAAAAGGRGDDGSILDGLTHDATGQTQLPAEEPLLPFLQSSPPRAAIPPQQAPQERPRQSTPRGPELNSDDFLQLLAADDFSSPSILGRGGSADRTRPDRGDSQTKIETPSPARQQSSSSGPKTTSLDSMPQTRRRSGAAAASRLRSVRGGDVVGASTTGASGSAALAVPGSYPAAASPSPIPEASPSRTRTAVKRRRSGEPVTTGAASTSASASATAPMPAETTGTRANSSRMPQAERDRMVLDDDLFGSDNGDIEVVNLTGADRPDAASQEDEKVAVAPPPAPSSRVKLAAYQCAICMDDVTNLMVTHCGHLFCGKCLHSSLYMDATRKVCPICRQKIELRGGGQTKTARSYFPLELKLMTRNRQGKQPARVMIHEHGDQHIKKRSHSQPSP